MTRMMWLAAPMLLAAPTLARADDAFPVKLKIAGVGDVVLVERTATTTTETKTIDAKGKTASDDTDKETDSDLFREILVAQEAGKPPTKIRREYDKAKTRQGDKATEFPYSGKAVLIERKKDGKFHFQIEGGMELTGDDAQFLDGEFNTTDEFRDFEQRLIPDHPVKAGEEWKLDMAPIVRAVCQYNDMEGDAAKARGTGKLVKVYSNGDRTFGRFLIHFEFPIKSAGSGKDKQEALEGSAAVYDISMDACIDGKLLDESLHWTSSATINTATDLNDGTKGKSVVVVKTEMTETDKEQPKK